MTYSLKLGAFELQYPIGRGGIGEVWRAVHLEQGVEVAIKVMTARRARETRYHQAFHGEVQAVARLDHPNIVRVFDAGEVSAQTARASGGRLVAGSPYLAMELGAGTLRDLELQQLDWPAQRTILLRLLDALAHAHARGVIHRDLKPANVLVVNAEGGPTLKLTDFGIAHALLDWPARSAGVPGQPGHDGPESREGDDHDALVTGTPRFMAPEQILGRWRDQGPWTDLYAVGCLAWWLASGTTPYDASDVGEVLRGHLYAPLPTLETWADVPDALGPWLERMLAREIGARYPFAADAAHELARIGAGQAVLVALPEDAFGDPDERDELSGPGRATDAATVHERERSTLLATDTVVDRTPSASSAAALQLGLVRTGEPASNTPPPIRAHWSTPARWHARPSASSTAAPPDTVSSDTVSSDAVSSDTAPRLQGVGLGLYGLRVIPLVDRTDERDAMWQSLREVHETRCPRAVLLRGAAGHGKTRLADWLARRSHELGAAHVLRATHSPMAHPVDALAHMFGGHLVCHGLSRDQIFERVRLFFGEGASSDDLYDAVALTEIIASVCDPTFDASKIRVRMSTPGERYGVLARALARIARVRPVVLCLDDVQWSGESVRFVRHLLGAGGASKLPVLAVMTVQDEAISQAGAQDGAQSSAQGGLEALEALTSLPTVRCLELGPLAPDAHLELVHHLLGLEQQLAREVARRTTGNPLFAVQLVGDWVERGILQVGPAGFVLRAGARAPLPDDIHHLLAARLHRLTGATAASPDDAHLALELAAVLGQNVAMHEWAALCEQEGVRLPDDLVEAAVRGGLAHWLPAQRPTADDVAAADRPSSRSSAGWSSSRWAFGSGALRECLIRLSREHGRLEAHHRACAALLERLHGAGADGAQGRGIAGRIGRHLFAARAWPAAASALLMGADEFRVSSDFQQAHLLLDLHAAALSHIEAGARGAAGEQSPLERWQLEGWIRRARVHVNQEQLEPAEALLDRAELRVRHLALDDLLAELCFVRGVVARSRGDAQAGMSAAREALSCYRATRQPLGVAKATQLLADLSLTGGDLGAARRFYTEALRLSEQLRDDNEIASCKQGLGAVLVALGSHDDAQHLFSQAMVGYEKVANTYGLANCTIALGEICRYSRDYPKAERYYHRALVMLERLGLGHYQTVHLNIALALLGQRRFAEAEQKLAPLLEAAIESGRIGIRGLIHGALLASTAAAERWEAFDDHLELALEFLSGGTFVHEDVAFVVQLGAEVALERGKHARARRAFSLALEQWRALRHKERIHEVERRLASLSTEPA